MSKQPQAGKNAKDSGQGKLTRDPRIHPVFGPGNFTRNLDYENAFSKAALLASRILKSKQSYHWLHATWFGKNKRTWVPSAFKDELPPEVPEEYRSKRGVGELTEEEIKAVDSQLMFLSSRVHFRVKHLAQGSIGWTKYRERRSEEWQGCRSTIWIGRNFYNAIRRKHKPLQRALLHFSMAIVFLHEFGHAAHIHLMGERCEDFFEDCLVAEAGFSYVTSLFGMDPKVLPENLFNLNVTWHNWETLHFLNPLVYPLDEMCRHVSKLPVGNIWHQLDPAFAVDLLSDSWWEAAEDRSVDIVPKFLLQDENAHLLAMVPSSLRIWLQKESNNDLTAQRDGTGIQSPIELRCLAPSDSAPLEVDTPLPSRVSRVRHLDVVHESPLSPCLFGPTPCDSLPSPTLDDIRDIIPHDGIAMDDLMQIFKPRLRNTHGFVSLVVQACRLDQENKRIFLKEEEDTVDAGKHLQLTGSDDSDEEASD